MGFRDPFQYRTRADIDKGWPDLRTGTKWKLRKIQKVKTNSLRLIGSIKDIFNLRMDTIWLAQFYFQRYFCQNAFQTNTALVFITACIHMACKANDLPRPLDKVIRGTYKLRYAREEAELKKIDDMMVFVEFKERVLLAERALLYSFAFDFRTGDPYSFALKYNSAYKLMCEQQAFDWLTFAAQATTLCLQYPPSMLAVAALWFAQHLVHGEVPMDQDGLEWWEKLPVEKQDRAPLQAPTAEAIEDVHWQLVPELDQNSLEVALDVALRNHPDRGRLPGGDCSCKACTIHRTKLEDAAAAAAANPAGAAAPAAAAASADAAEAGPSLPDAQFTVGANGQGAPALSSDLLEAPRDTGASAPRTGTSQSATHQHPVIADPPALTDPTPAGPGLATAGTVSGAPPHIDQPSSAYPVRPVSRGRTASPAAAVLAADSSNRGAHASPSGRPAHLQNGQSPANSPLQQKVPSSKGGPSRLHPPASQSNGHAQARQAQPMPPPSAHRQQPQSKGSMAADNGNGLHQGTLDGHSRPATSNQSSQLQQGSESAHAYQSGHQLPNADDDTDSLEEGEIEGGEVLPDGSIAGESSDAHTNGALPHTHTNGDVHDAHANGSLDGSHDAGAYAQPADGSNRTASAAGNGVMQTSGKAHDLAKKRKRSASPESDAAYADADDAQKSHALPQDLRI